MDAIERTKQLERVFLKTTVLEPQEVNPNEMSDAEFNLLCDNVEKMGITDPILVRPKKAEEITPERPATHRIVGGYHRWEVAKLMGFEEVPCTVVTDPSFDADAERFQIVRMNVIRGKLSPEKFFNLYSQMSNKYADEILAESFGFASEDEFRKLIAQVKKGLPKELQKDFAKAAAELKTIDDLTNLLNRLFTKYGDTLPYGFMCLDFGGKDSVWLRLTNDTRQAVLDIGKVCMDNRRTVDDLIGGLIRMAANGQLSQQLVQLIAESPEVDIPDGLEMPTAEALAGNPNMLM